MTNTPPPGPPAGWYPHPDMAATQRYWDGQDWTDHIAPAAPVTPATRPRDYYDDDLEMAAFRAQLDEPDRSGLIVAGYVTAVLLPVVGFVIGLVLLAKRPEHGVRVLILTVLALVVWYNLITPDAPTYNSYGGY